MKQCLVVWALKLNEKLTVLLKRMGSQLQNENYSKDTEFIVHAIGINACGEYQYAIEG